MRIQTILACTDFSPASEHAVRRAVWLARDLGAQLALAHAIPANLFEMIDNFWLQAEAERERRAKIIHAEGELQASEKLLAAAEILARQP